MTVTDRPTDVDADVLVIGGGPAGSVAASFLAQAGHSVILVERDIHPRHHVGESLTPSSNLIWDRLGFLPKMEAAGFVHKPGACWTAPRSPVGAFVSIRLAEYPIPGSKQPYTYNVERELLDALLLRHARELGTHVLEGVKVEEVLFEGDRAVGARVRATERHAFDLRARVVIDASGRRCLIASQLGLRHKDPTFNQVGMYTWFEDVEPAPPSYEGMIMLHFLGLERAWCWQIPLQNGVWSVGVVTERKDFRPGAKSDDDHFEYLMTRNQSLRHNLRNARRVQPWRVEADYTYKVERFAGPGWLLAGDALRFVDPVFSTGVDVATYSAMYAADAVNAVLGGADESETFSGFERKVTDGIDAWYELIRLFYEMQNLFTYFAVKPRYREKVVRILQGNLYDPEALERAREIVSMMKESLRTVESDPSCLLRPWGLTAPPPTAMAAQARSGEQP